jgi:hypothetical protein
VVKRRYSPNKNALTGQPKKAQEHRMEKDLSAEITKFPATSLPQKYENARDADSDPLTNDVIILGEDVHPSSPDFIGPHDAYDDGREFLLRRIEDVALIAMTNLVASPKYHHHLLTDVVLEMDRGHLRLSKEYPNMDAHGQAELFIEDNFKRALENRDDVQRSAVEENIEAIRAMQAVALEQNKVIKDLETKNIQAQLTLLEIRQSLKESNITPDQMAVFDKRAKISTPAHIEDEEHTKSTTGKFWNIVSHLSRKTFESMGIVAPKSAEVTVIHLDELLPRY